MTRTIIIAVLYHIGSNLMAQQRYTCEGGTIRFVSEAALETIKASSQAMEGVLDPATNRFAFRVLIRSFTGFNSPLQQEHFKENYLESNTFETAIFEGRIVDEVDYQFDGQQNIRAKGMMFIHGVKNEEIVPCTLKVERLGVQVTSEFYLLLSDYDITIPKVVSRKISEEIKVEVTAFLELK